MLGNFGVCSFLRSWKLTHFHTPCISDSSFKIWTFSAFLMSLKRLEFFLTSQEIVSKRKQNSLSRFSSPHQLVVFLVKYPSLRCVVRSRFFNSMTDERLSGPAKMLFHRGTNYMPTPKDIYEWKSNLRHLLQLVSQTSRSIVKCLVY